MKTRNRGSNFPPGVVSLIRQLAQLEFSAAEIRRRLLDSADISDVPSLSTVQNIARPFRPRDSSGNWDLRDSPADHIPIALRFLAVVIRMTEGRRAHISKREADIAIRFQFALPDISDEKLFNRVYLYNLMLESGADTGLQDAFLALQTSFSSDQFEKDKEGLQLAAAMAVRSGKSFDMELLREMVNKQTPKDEHSALSLKGIDLAEEAINAARKAMNK